MKAPLLQQIHDEKRFGSKVTVGACVQLTVLARGAGGGCGEKWQEREDIICDATVSLVFGLFFILMVGLENVSIATYRLSYTYFDILLTTSPRFPVQSLDGKTLRTPPRSQGHSVSNFDSAEEHTVVGRVQAQVPETEQRQESKTAEMSKLQEELARISFEMAKQSEVQATVGGNVKGH
uniref:Uncharacterized protein n=1 Tax=Romanomermis culicivorax TaxID=13658 RepID=A0A915IRJ1_ROMCU